MKPITTARVRIRPQFVKVNGRYARHNPTVEVPLRSAASGDSLGKFPRSVGAISHHRWS